MPISRTSFEADRSSEHSAIGARTALDELVGQTPLVTLQRSGDGRVHLKLEGTSVGGGFHDRIARAQLARTPAHAPVVLVGLTAHTASALTLARAQGRKARVIVPADASRRLHLLCRAYEPEVKKAASADELESLLEDARNDGFVLLRRDDADAVRAALAETAESVRNEGALANPDWVVPDYGLTTQEVRRALGASSDTLVMTVADDGEEARTLDGSVACRRAQLGHREGILLGPLGAEIANAAIESALCRDRDTVALIPDSGNRYLGWW